MIDAAIVAIRVTTLVYTQHFNQQLENHSRKQKCPYGSEMYSKSSIIRLQLIRMSDNADRNMKNEKCCSQLSTYFKDTWHLGR
jgi:hypothetical protein